MMISLIVVALVGIGFTRLTMLALELRDNYEDGPNDGPADMTRKRVDAHNRMVSMPKPAEMILKGDNRYEPKSSKADFKGEGTYSSVLASTEATLQAGFNAIFNYGPVEQKPSSYQGGPSAGDEGAKGAREANSEEEADDVERTNAEPSQSSVLIDPTDVCTICFEKAKNAVILDCGHGGLCYNCSIDVYVTSGHCPFCRNEIGQIVTVGFASISADSTGNSVVPVVGPR